MDEVFEITSSLTRNKAFRLVETLFVQANQVRTESKQTSLFGNKKMRLTMENYIQHSQYSGFFKNVYLNRIYDVYAQLIALKI